MQKIVSHFPQFSKRSTSKKFDLQFFFFFISIGSIIFCLSSAALTCPQEVPQFWSSSSLAIFRLFRFMTFFLIICRIASGCLYFHFFWLPLSGQLSPISVKIMTRLISERPLDQNIFSDSVLSYVIRSKLNAVVIKYEAFVGLFILFFFFKMNTYKFYFCAGN